MSGYMGDISQLFATGATNNIRPKHSTSREGSDSLDMTDFLTLMVAQFQNQSMDNTADTSDMLNQLVQMQVVQAITNITDASLMTYAASLVGKEVTIGEFDGNGQLKETVGMVTGTGMSDGEQVIFIGNDSYSLSDIMAVGRLPELKTSGTEDEEKDESEPSGGQ